MDLVLNLILLKYFKENHLLNFIKENKKSKFIIKIKLLIYHLKSLIFLKSMDHLDKMVVILIHLFFLITKAISHGNKNTEDL